MSYSGEERRAGNGRRKTDNEIPCIGGECKEISDVKKWFRWAIGILVSALIAATILLTGVIKDVNANLTAIKANQSVLMNKIGVKPYRW